MESFDMKRSKEISAVATLIGAGVVVYSFNILITTDSFLFDFLVGVFSWLFSFNVPLLLVFSAALVVLIYLVIYFRMSRV